MNKRQNGAIYIEDEYVCFTTVIKKQIHMWVTFTFVIIMQNGGRKTFAQM